jgi:uncharacterized protein (TIGR03435 family)
LVEGQSGFFIKVFHTDETSALAEINNKGIIIWQNIFSKLPLTKYTLQKITSSSNTISSAKQIEFEQETEDYTFTLQKHSMDMGRSSYSNVNRHVVEVVNQDLREILELLWKIKYPRIVNVDEVDLQTPYDLSLQIKDSIEESETEQIARYLLNNQLNFYPRAVERDTTYYQLMIADSAKLANHLSNNKYYWSSSTDKRWEAKGATLKNLADYLETKYNLLAEDGTSNHASYDFELKPQFLRESREILRDKYGITLTQIRGKIVMYELHKIEY